MRRIGRALVRSVRRHPAAYITWIVILVGWEVASHIVPESAREGAPIVPSWEFVWTDSFKAISGNWTQDWGAPTPVSGGEETYRGAFLALGYHSLATLVRLILGLAIGVIAGVGTGLAISYWAVARRMAWPPLNFLRMLPLLAAIPLFQFWLGANTRGTTTFIAFGVWVVLVVGTINAVRNVPDRYIESARTLGATRPRTYMRVVVPGSIPELRTSLLLAAGLSWSLTVGAEYIGLRDGLGSIMAVAEYFTNTGRMIVIAVVVGVYALLTFAILDRLFNRLVSWMPRVEADEGIAQVAGAGAAAAGQAARLG
ncbi:MAG TPA: ABC transporter permease subunit [Solirubrobacteraceae bacterium]|nr:ABC transporter permease subunit [Solirubrobacteraceae bacterium]